MAEGPALRQVLLFSLSNSIPSNQLKRGNFILLVSKSVGWSIRQLLSELFNQSIGMIVKEWYV